MAMNITKTRKKDANLCPTISINKDIKVLVFLQLGEYSYNKAQLMFVCVAVRVHSGLFYNYAK